MRDTLQQLPLLYRHLIQNASCHVATFYNKLPTILVSTVAFATAILLLAPIGLIVINTVPNIWVVLSVG